MILLAFMLTFLVPSGTACVVIMAAISLGLLDAYGFGVGSNIRRCMFITLSDTPRMIDKMVIPGPASIVGVGIGLVETLPGLCVLKVDAVKNFNFVSIIFVARAIGLSEVLIQTKALDVVTNVKFAWMEPWVKNVFALAFVPYWKAFFY